MTTKRIEWQVPQAALTAFLEVRTIGGPLAGTSTLATLDDLRKACEAVGLVAIERSEAGSGESWRIAADALQAERDILSGQNATLRAQLAEVEAQHAATQDATLFKSAYISKLEAQLADRDRPPPFDE
jgi:predicted GNAT family N-acyltransferase